MALPKINTPKLNVPQGGGSSSGSTIWWVLGTVATLGLLYKFVYLPYKEKQKANDGQRA